jgi:hypothetical protein
MRKRIIGSEGRRAEAGEGPWLDLEALAVAEVSSEDPEHPVEGALVPGDARGWQAAAPGPQTLRLVFDRPQDLARVRLVFEAHGQERTQEFFLGWAAGATDEPREILRQQWNFSPEAAHEEEDLEVTLTGVGVLELYLVPDITGGDATASLTELRLAASG